MKEYYYHNKEKDTYLAIYDEDSLCETEEFTLFSENKVGWYRNLIDSYIEEDGYKEHLFYAGDDAFMLAVRLENGMCGLLDFDTEEEKLIVTFPPMYSNSDIDELPDYVQECINNGECFKIYPKKLAGE